jgi:hypothetical protein
MKQRITYVVPDPSDFNPDLLTVQSTLFSLQNLKAAKEHRITFNLDELPLEVYSLNHHTTPSQLATVKATKSDIPQLGKAFSQWHELHIRWASSTAYPSTPPYTSRVSPGLHVFFTPLKNQPEGPLCPLIKKAFGLEVIKCENATDSFIKLPVLSERFSQSASAQFYAYVSSLSPFVAYVRDRICTPASTSCKKAAEQLADVGYLDVDYDAISHAVVVNAFWAQAPKESWTETIRLADSEETIEIGVLNHEINPDPEDVQFSGFLTVLGRDEKPSTCLSILSSFFLLSSVQAI